VKWILDMDSRGYAPRVGYIQRKANLLLAERVRGTDTRPLTVGRNWATKFIKRRFDLTSKYLRKYDYRRALCEDPEVIAGWFRLVANVKAKYGIADEDVYNFDETGFQMGVISTAKVVTGSERRGKPLVKQPGNREWVTVIETISANGSSLDPLIIFAGKVHQTSWFRELQAAEHRRWRVAVSSNGWTNDEIGLMWLKEIFDEGTKRYTQGKYRLLILDGHHSHNTPEFNDYCKENDIIALYMPPHASHLLQPLDIACYSPLKRAYGRQVEELMRLGQHHIDKSEFLERYIPARRQAISESNIMAAFRASGLVPFDPSAVLDKLDAIVRTPTPTPPPSSQDPEQGWVPETPQNISQVHHQARTIRKSLKRKTVHTPSPTNKATVQMAKVAEQTMYALRLAQERIADLESQVDRLSKKRMTKTTYIKNAGILSAEQVDLSPIEEPEEGDEDTIVIRSTATQRRCRRCNEPGHNSRTCTS